MSPSQAAFIPCLAEIAKIMRKIMKLVCEDPFTQVIIVRAAKIPQVNRMGRRHHDFSPSHALVEALQNDLDYWKDSLPPHLRFQNEESVASPPSDSPCSWRARQRSSLRIREFQFPEAVS